MKKREKGKKLDPLQEMRNEMFDFLRKSSMMKYNLRTQNVNDFISARRSSKTRKIDKSTYTICTICNGTYLSEAFGKHFKRCNKSETKNLKQAKLDYKALLLKNEVRINVHFKRVLLRIREGEIKDTIMKDRIIINFGNAYSYKHRQNEHQDKMIRAKVRLAALFLLVLTEVSCGEITQYSDFFVPENFDYLIPAINVVGKYNTSTDLYDTPATAAAAGAYVKEMCDLHITNCIKSKNKTAKQDALDFMHLFAVQYPKYVSKTVAKSQLEQQRMKQIDLPTASDMKIFYNFLINKWDELMEKMKKNLTSMIGKN